MITNGCRIFLEFMLSLHLTQLLHLIADWRIFCSLICFSAVTSSLDISSGQLESLKL